MGRTDGGQTAMNWFLYAIPLLVAAGCSQPRGEPTALTLATTTSTRDSGLLDVLVPIFEEETGIGVKVVAVGSGQALELGRRGDVDVLLTHAPEAEQQFMAEGYGEEHRSFMYNDFVLVGPQTDPAQLNLETSIIDAFRQIVRTQSLFVSRGDESGTHMKEKSLWNRAGLPTAGEWYVEAGAGMAEALRMASHKQAYTLTDRATFLAQQKGLKLTILSEGDPLLQNRYSVIVVSRRKHPHVQDKAARRFATFLLSRQAKTIIRQFGVRQFGQPLFFVESPAPE